MADSETQVEPSNKLKRTAESLSSPKACSPKVSRQEQGSEVVENQAPVEESEDSGFQDNDVHPMDIDDNDIDDNANKIQASLSFDGNSNASGDSDIKSQEEHLPEELMAIKVDEDSNDEMLITTGLNNRRLAESVLQCTIEIGSDAASRQKKETKRRKKEGLAKDDETAKELVLKLSCALLNSGGGVLKMKIEDFPQIQNKKTKMKKNDPVDSFWKTVEPQLKAMIRPSKYDDVFDRHEGEESDEILLYITAPQHVCTLDYNLYVPTDSGKDEASYQETVDLLKESQGNPSKVTVSLKDLPEVPGAFTHNEVLNLKETKQIQFKQFTSETVLDSNNRSQREGISNQVSAFANGGGGLIFLGVEDDGEVCGLDVERNSTEVIETRVNAIVNNMRWNFTPKKEDHWDIKFFPVLDCASKAIAVISVAGMSKSGGVFVKSPKSYKLRHREDEEQPGIHPLEFDEWKERILSAVELQGNSKGMKDMLARFNKLRVSKGHLLTVKGDVQRIKDTFFNVEEGFPVLPKGFESNLPEEARAVIQKVQNQCSRNGNRGLLVASRSWLGNTGGTPIGGVICDLLLISRDMGGLHLFTLCHSAGDETFLQYSRKAAQSIKRNLVENGACGEKFYVSYHVVSCTEAAEIELAFPDTRYPKSYELKTRPEKLNEVLKAMVIILAAVPSTLSNKLGVSIMNLLTMEQFNLVYQQIEINRELWVKGVAGSGKTLVTVEFMRELLRRENLDVSQILCVCENDGIANKIRKSDVCKVVCRQTFMRDNENFSDVKHVVMDEVHNYEQPMGTNSWFQKARSLVRQHDPKNPGYLWFFTDKCQSNHNFPSGIPEESEQKPQVWLTKVIRNSRKIFNRAKKYITQGDVVGEMGHDFEGENVKEITYKTPKTTQLDVLNETFHNLLKEGYRAGDIAILFNTGDSIPNNLSVKLKTTCTAATNDHLRYLVVSSVLKFSGLDRPVVVLVDANVPSGRKRDPFFYCGVTRAMVKLIIISQSRHSIRSYSKHVN